ncbi:MAG: hypothetical protein AAFQ94_09260 [Bacteroidota bacterium]
MIDLFDKSDGMPYPVFCEIHYFESHYDFFTVQVYDGIVVRFPPDWIEKDYTIEQLIKILSDYKHQKL